MGYTANQSCCICGGGIFKSLSPSISPQIQNNYREPTSSGNLSISPEMAMMKTRPPSLGEISPLVQNSFLPSVYPSISFEVTVTLSPSSKESLPPSSSPVLQTDFLLESVASVHPSIPPEVAVIKTLSPSSKGTLLPSSSLFLENNFSPDLWTSEHPSIAETKLSISLPPSISPLLQKKFPSDLWPSERPSLPSDIYSTPSSSPSINDSFGGFQDIDKTNEILTFSSADASTEGSVSKGTTDNSQKLDSSKEISRDTLIVVSAFVAAISVIAIAYAKVGRPI